jgi:hypothetical protein
MQLEYPRQVARWQVVPHPSESDMLAYERWLCAANYAIDIEWRVFVNDGQVCAQLTNELLEQQPTYPNFTPPRRRFYSQGRRIYCPVDDGWLVGFNNGEFGAALYWFSHDGERNYKISDHQVVDFISTPNGILAIEGLAHFWISEGSLISISRQEGSDRWQAHSIVELTFAPEACSLCRDGTILITLSDVLVVVGSDHQIQTLLASTDWGDFYPKSSVLSPDEKKLYIGMRQYVGEFDFETKQLRYLIPNENFLNKLSKKEEDVIEKSIRNQLSEEEDVIEESMRN